MADLLLELGVEELPASYLPGAIEQLAADAAARLQAALLAHGEIRASGTPRRLVLAVAELAERQPDRTEEIAGPPAAVAFRDGKPTPAAEGFARKSGVAVSELVIRDTPRGPYVHAVRRLPGRPARELLPELLRELVLGLRFPKSMRWPQAPRGETFARPVRRLLALLGDEALPLEVFGVRAGRQTEGHPILAGRRPIALERADYAAYLALLRQHCVLADRQERREAIAAGLARVLGRHGARLRHPELLEELTDMVECPAVLEGRFEERYLELPAAVLQAAMTDHQRYVPVIGQDERVRPVFAFVVDQPEPDPVIVHGNERVLRARLEDAAFYLREDLKRPLAEREAALAGIVFHQRLGTMLDKTRRLERLAGRLAELAGLDEPARAALVRAAALAKADLSTELVGEFPQLHGEIGAEYLARQGEPPAVVAAVREHVLPRFAADAIATSLPGRLLALADRLDNLCGFFAAGLGPTGSTDPFALRRQAQGVVRTLLEGRMVLPLAAAVEQAAAGFAELAAAPGQAQAGADGGPGSETGAQAARRGLLPPAQAAEEVLGFLRERLANQLREQGHRHDLVEAALAGGGALVDFGELVRRLEALAALAAEPDFPALVEVVDRTWRIVRGEPPPAAAPDPALFQQPEEHALAAALAHARSAFEQRLAAGDLRGAAEAYRAALARPVHVFFERVFVNVQDARVRANRLALLWAVNRLFVERFADLSRVVLEGSAAAAQG
ncbi:MAG: glycine--tRNA ligase beta subunit [Planctomycetota bacterium]|nr:MAG: glycine--tRNA ligase beta subunit [Planctomycetota bacterium]